MTVTLVTKCRQLSRVITADASSQHPPAQCTTHMNTLGLLRVRDTEFTLVIIYTQ